MNKLVLTLLGLGIWSATLYAGISFQSNNSSANTSKTDTTKTVIVTEKIPGMNCICKASDGCKSPMTAKYECSNTPIQNTSPTITPTQTSSTVIVTEPIPWASCICKASDGCKNLTTRKYECTTGKTSTQNQEVYVTKCSCIQIQKDGSPKVDTTGNSCKNLQTALLKCTPITK